MTAAVASREKAGPCCNKSKQAGALTDEEARREKQNDTFLEEISKNELEMVEAMIKNGQAVNVGDEFGNSSVHKAVKLSSDKMLKLCAGQASTTRTHCLSCHRVCVSF